MDQNPQRLRARIRFLLAVFIIGLVLSGLTAFPLETELRILCSFVGVDPAVPASTYTGLQHWIALVAEGLRETYAKFPFIAYGTDWLAFGHFMIALVFVGALIDPVRNRWLFTFGMLACALVPPWALVFGHLRGIPLWWRAIDAAFGFVGFVPAWLCDRWAGDLEARAGARGRDAA